MPGPLLAAAMPGIVEGGFSLAGGAVSGIGAKLEQDRLDREKRRKEEIDRANLERQQKISGRQFDRTAGMSGIAQLAQMRGMATQNAQGKMFRKDLIKAMGG